MTSSWERMIDELRPVGERVAKLAYRADTEQSRQETYRMLTTGFAQGVIERLFGDPDYPEFTPHINHILNLAAPVPDFVYFAARIRSEGSYRISGYRGTVRFCDMNIRAGQYADASGTGAVVGYIDLDQLKQDERGYFSVLLSPAKPANYAGDWVKLDPSASYILVRVASYDWNTEIDPRLAIERLDIPAIAPRVKAQEISEDLAILPAWTERLVGRWLDNPIAELRRKGLVNAWAVANYGAIGGAVGQIYYEGLYDITSDDVVIIETEVPQTGRYWSVLVTEDQYATINWMNHQCSLNAFQARLDSDGKFRAVIALEDPGVPNWLDTGGYTQGAMQLRWNNCSSEPVPTVRKVPFKDVRKHLPVDTPVISAAERDRLMRIRREGAQLRRFW